MKYWLLLFCLLLPASVKAQGDYLGRESIGKPSPTPVTTPNARPLPVSEWVGQKFIFMPRDVSLRKYGYQGIHKKRGKEWDSLPYEKYVGRVAKVIAVRNDTTLGGILRAEIVDLQMEDDGELLTARTVLNNIASVTPLFDIDHARAQYAGKTLWYADTTLRTYDADTGKVDFITIKKKYRPVTVTRVLVGESNDAPVRFVVKTDDGIEGYVDLAISGTNADASLVAYHRFADHFLTEDPRITYKWPEDVWKAIEQGEVFIGMTQRQVLLSKGRPSKINTTESATGMSEQWVYGRSIYLHFNNGVLTVIQD
jgi:hypothetical protein